MVTLSTQELTSDQESESTITTEPTINYSLGWVHPDDIDNIWPLAKDWLQLALDRNDGEYELEDIYQDIIKHRYQLWVMYNGEFKAGIVTEIIEYPRKKAWEILLLGGEDMNEWLPTLETQMTLEAKATGCSSIRIIGRSGWAKVLTGFESKHVMLSKQL